MVALYVREPTESDVAEVIRIRDETSYSLRSIDASTLTAPFSDSPHSQRSISFDGAKVYSNISLKVKKR